MLAENLENWAKRERREGEEHGILKGREEAARNLIAQTSMVDQTIAGLTGLAVEQVQELRKTSAP